MTVNFYTIEDKDGIQELCFFSQSYQEAVEYARVNHLRVICNEFEFSDSYMIDDFTDEDKEN